MTDQLATERRKHPVRFYLNQRNTQTAKDTMMLALRRAMAAALDENIRNVPEKQVWEFPWPQVDSTELAELYTALKDRDYSQATVSLTDTAVRGVLEACYHLKMIKREQWERIDMLDRPTVSKAEKDVGRLVEESEYNDMLESCQGDGLTGIRDAAMLAVLWDTGVRVSELVNLRIHDYMPRKGRIFVKQGKGGKDREVPINNGEKDLLDEYLEVRGFDPGPLFYGINPLENDLRKSGDGITKYTVNKMLKKRQGLIGIPEDWQFSPHDFRRTAITRWANNPAIGILGAQYFAGHKSIETTRRYYRGDAEKYFAAAAEM